MARVILCPWYPLRMFTLGMRMLTAHGMVCGFVLGPLSLVMFINHISQQCCMTDVLVAVTALLSVVLTILSGRSRLRHVNGYLLPRISHATLLWEDNWLKTKLFSIIALFLYLLIMEVGSQHKCVVAVW